MIKKTAVLLFLMNIAASSFFNSGCANDSGINDEVLTFENISSSGDVNANELTLEEKSNEDFFYDPWSYYGYGFGGYGFDYGYGYGYGYGYPLLTPYTYGFADYYTQPLVFETPLIADFPILTYEHPFYAPYLLGTDPFFDDDDFHRFVDDEH